jgi:hypothetical protein
MAANYTTLVTHSSIQFQYFIRLSLKGCVTTEFRLYVQMFEKQCFEEIIVNTEIKAKRIQISVEMCGDKLLT